MAEPLGSREMTEEERAMIERETLECHAAFDTLLKDRKPRFAPSAARSQTKDK